MIDKAKRMLVQCGAVPPLVDGLLSGISSVQSAAVCAIAQLSGEGMSEVCLSAYNYR